MKVSNKSIRERCNQEDIMVDVARRRWNWIGHVLRKPDNSITKEALYWTPEGNSKRGRRSVEEDWASPGVKQQRLPRTGSD